MKKSHNPYLASLLSVPIPGMGQIYAGKLSVVQPSLSSQSLLAI
jgi:hypothetical protein